MSREQALRGELTGFRTESESFRAYVRLRQAKAREGKIPSLILLGDLHLNGQLVHRSHATAILYYQLAIEKGSVEAMVKMGTAYEFTFGETPDHAKAYAWYSCAADFGMPRMKQRAYRLVDSGKLSIYDGQVAYEAVQKELFAVRDLVSARKISNTIASQSKPELRHAFNK